MKRFLQDESGNATSGKIITLGLVAVLMILLFRFSVYVQCTANVTLDRFSVVIYSAIFQESTEDCAKKGKEADPNTGFPIFKDETSENDPTYNNGTPRRGGTVGGDPNAGGKTVDGVYYEPIAYFNSSGVNLECKDTNTYYKFFIPEEATPQSIGTQTLSITNKKGWDMWVKIKKVEPEDGLKITDYIDKYYEIKSGEKAPVKVKWYWNVPMNYYGKDGSATVYFEVECKKPAANMIYKPLPEMPGNFQFVEKTENTLMMKWDPSEYSTSYKVVRNDGAVVYQGTNKEFKDTNLLPGTSYSYKLYGVNETGMSPYASIYTTTSGVSPLPAMPKNLKAIEVKDTSITVKWDPVDKADTYTVHLRSTHVYTGPLTQFKIENLTPGEHYNIWVKANNQYGSSNQALIGVYTTGESPYPGTIYNFKVIDRTESSLKLQWDPVDKAQKYQLYLGGTKKYEGTDKTFEVTGLTPGTSYGFTLYAINSYGNKTAYTTGLTLGEDPYPSAPSNIQVTDITNTSLKLSWQKGSNNTTSFTVKKDGVVVYEGSDTSYQFTGLIPGSTYSFHVRSNNDKGTSNWIYKSGTTTYQSYDGSSDVTNSCEPNTFNKTFEIPSTAKPGTNGQFMMTINNNTSNAMNVKIESVVKNGGFFAGNTPITLSYDGGVKALNANSLVQMPINWTFPSGDAAEYSGKSGSIDVTIKTSCN